MPTIRQPKSGTWQFWHRARASRPYAKVRNYTSRIADPKPLGFAGYKAGMGHAIVTDNRPNSPNFKAKISVPFTIIECPPIKVCGVTLYRKTPYGFKKIGQMNSEKQDKELGRKIPLSKKPGKPLATEADMVRLVVHTQPKLVGLKKVPELFELAVGGKTIPEQLETAKNLLGKEVSLKDVFSDGNQVDIHAVTRGHGIQGPVKRFGVALRSHKSEKTKRGPGNVGPWAGNRSWTVSHAGQMGYHLRFQHNSVILRVGDNGADVSPSGGIPHYGMVRNQYLLLKGSVGGSAKRLVRLTHSIRPNRLVPKDAPKIDTLVL